MEERETNYQDWLAAGDAASVPAAIKVTERQLSITVPIGQFIDYDLSGVKIKFDGSDLGSCRTRRWTDKEIASYWKGLRLWEKYGTRVVRIANALGRDEVHGGLVGAMASRYSIPLRKPSDRSGMIRNCMIVGDSSQTNPTTGVYVS